MNPIRTSMLILLLGFAASTGCKKAPQNKGGAVPSAAAAVDDGQLRGKVVETFDSGGYSYVKLDTASGERWAAVRKANLAKGQPIVVSNISEMKNFKSRSLNRTFKSIYFGSLGAGAGGNKQAKRTGMGGHGGMMGNPHKGMGSHGAKGGGDEVKRVTTAHSGMKHAKQPFDKPLARADGPSGVTVAEIFAKKAALKDKVVVIRGKVTKFNANIMGKNWLHLQDGSGTAAAKDFDLTVTTKGSAKVGDVVVVRGKLRVDRDFGAGYSYDAIVEEATLKP